MNLIHKVTRECMKRNRKRTLVTILGVIISVAMISGVSTITASFLDLIRQTTIEGQGEWHIDYNSVNGAYMDALEDKDIQNTVISSTVGYATLPVVKNPQKPYVYLQSFEDGCMDRLPIRLLEGRFPKTEQEIMLPSSLLKSGDVDYQIGDQVSFDVGKRVIDVYEDRDIDQRYSYQKGHEELTDLNLSTFTVTGIYDDRMLYSSINAGYDVISGFEKGTYDAAKSYDVKVQMANVSRSIYEFAEDKAEELHSESYNMNSTLLMTYGINMDGRLLLTVFAAVTIVGIIILIGSVSLIYNAFAISLGERSRYLGMLSSVGATKRQKQSSVFYEAALIGRIAIPIGFLLGYLGMWITFHYVNDLVLDTLIEKSFGDIQLRLTIEPFWFCAALAFSVLILVISAWRPALRASRISSIDAIRQTGVMQVKGKQVKTSRITRKLFGFEAELAIKNMKRNKSRYVTTLFSLVVSVVLFLSVSSFQNMIEKSFAMSTQDVYGNLQVMIRNLDGSPQADAYVEEMTHVPGVTSAIQTTSLTFFMDIPRAIASQELLDYADVRGIEGMGINIEAYDEETFHQYCEQIGADFESLHTDEIQGILINHVIYKEGHEFSDVNLFQIDAGATMDMLLYNGNTRNLETIPMKLAYISQEAAPASTNKVEDLTDITIVVSMQTMHSLQEQFTAMGGSASGLQTVLNMEASDPFAAETAMHELSERYPQYQNYITNMESLKNQQDQMSLMVSVFLYGFVALIMLVSCANIFNTISTGVFLRKQEFAMLKSVGITPKGFRKMLCYENLFYGGKALLYGIPISFLISYGIYRVLDRNFSFAFELPWGAVCAAVIGILTLVLLTMFYSIQKVKHDNIVDTIRNESI